MPWPEHPTNYTYLILWPFNSHYNARCRKIDYTLLKILITKLCTPYAEFHGDSDGGTHKIRRSAEIEICTCEARATCDPLTTLRAEKYRKQEGHSSMKNTASKKVIVLWPSCLRYFSACNVVNGSHVERASHAHISISALFRILGVPPSESPWTSACGGCKVWLWVFLVG